MDSCIVQLEQNVNTFIYKDIKYYVKNLLRACSLRNLKIG